MGERIFADDWRACQEQHLRAVLSAGDRRTEKTLVQVLQGIGFTRERLSELGAGPVAADDEGLAPVEALEDAPAPPPDDATGSGGAIEVEDEEVQPEPDEEDSDPTDADEMPGQLSLF